MKAKEKGYDIGASKVFRKLYRKGNGQGRGTS